MKKNKIIGFDKDGLKQWFLYWVILGIGFFVLFFLITSTWIGVSVREKCLVAQGRYSDTSCAEALMQTLDDESNSYRDRNNAIWALGQLGDPKALETVEKYYTGDIPSREPYDKGLSQYEMKKAIKLLNGGLNITHIVWNLG